MARPPRRVLPGIPLHITQRGNDRVRTFHDERDLAHFHEVLLEVTRALTCAVHAYVFMPNHVHLLLTPPDGAAPSRLMQRLGARYVRYVNTVYARTGTLWEGRFRSSVLEAPVYLLPAMVGLDWAPVRAGLAAQPQDWAWSSHAHYRGLRVDRLITPHAQYWALGNTPFDRENAYAEMVRTGLDEAQWQRMEGAARGGWALGSEPFLQALNTQGATRRLTQARPGRPRKSHPLD